MKKSAFISHWDTLKENKGTVNKCLVDFVNNVEAAYEKHSDDKFFAFVVAETGKYETNKQLNISLLDTCQKDEQGKNILNEKGKKVYEAYNKVVVTWTPATLWKVLEQSKNK